ncbi:MAG: hypothetical protein RL377_556, partial [Bacteroidota bacterium]
MKYLLFLTTLLVFGTANAQKDPAAKAILDQIGAKVKGAKGILVSLQLVSKNNKGKALGTKNINLKM